ncbi:UvrABC system protein A [Bacteroidia bacterium]|nr:UvrABC system protein A [Bacteroidia bacterium]
MQQKNIILKGVRVNNLRNINIEIPRNQFIVITGLSGSGKSSLAFDTIYAEGQRRYVESLSSYSRQFVAKMDKPELDFISGLSPSIAIEQKNANKNPRSTVGTVTEIYEYIKLLFARIGKTYSPISGKEVTRDSVSLVANYITNLNEGSKIYIYAPFIIKNDRSIEEQLTILQQMGFSRLGYIKSKNEIEIVNINEAKNVSSKKYMLFIDRMVIKKDDTDFYSRVFDSVQTAYYEGDGLCFVKIDDKPLKEFSNRFEADGIKFEKPNENFFSFNNPYGACHHCQGYGNVIDISENLVVPNQSLSVYEGAIAIWRGPKMGIAREQLISVAEKINFPIHKPYNKLTKEQKDKLWYGTPEFEGIYPLFKWIETQVHKIQYRVMLSHYKGKTTCPECEGTRLRKDAYNVKINEKSIKDLVLMSIEDLQQFFLNLQLSQTDNDISKRVLVEINNRIQFLMDVGLSYLTLNRASATLSGGESQKIRLATSLGSTLMGSIYILDEPSIGLHGRDTQKLIKVLQNLRDKGNTVIIVEHDKEIIRAADFIVDIGYLAGVNGGNLVFAGSNNELNDYAKKIKIPKVPIQDQHYSEFLKHPFSLTAAYVSGKYSIPVPSIRRKSKYALEIKGACENNLNNIDVKFPLDSLVVVTGVSGSGKTSLVKNTLYPAIKRHFGESVELIGQYAKLQGDITHIKGVELVDQNPIGRSTRSNPATYIKAYDDIRDLFANQHLSKTRNYKSGFFSFNTDGGRCETCKGEGIITVEMQFMADVHLKCEECNGRRFKNEVLEIKYHDKNISDILNMSIDESIDFFSPYIDKNKKNSTEKNIVTKLKSLQDVGLGYLKMGQSSDSISGGEAQRVKLAYHLSRGNNADSMLFIFDEPTTGLHLHDIHKLKDALNALIEIGHSIIIVEHHPDIIKLADHIIDIGVEGGSKGGNIVFEGTPEDLVKCKKSITAKFIDLS